MIQYQRSRSSGNALRRNFHSCSRLMASVLIFAAFASAALAWPAPAAAENGRRLIDESAIPVAGARMDDFVPEGWAIESTVAGDFNGDGRPDSVLELIEAAPAHRDNQDGMPPSRARALIVLIQTAAGEYRRAALAKRLLRCTDCFGMMAGPEGGKAEIRVVKNVLIVEEIWGSREMVHTRLRFRFDARSGRFPLIGEDFEYTDRATGLLKRTSSNFLTGVRLAETKRYDPKKERFVTLSRKKQSVARSRRFIEDIDYRDYEKQAESPGSE